MRRNTRSLLFTLVFAMPLPASMAIRRSISAK